MDSPYLAPIPRRTVTDEIVNRLVSLIISEGLKPGDRLPSERQLMAKLRVGRSSLREAVKFLSAAGTVVVSAGNGTFVGSGDIVALTKPLFLGLLITERTAQEFFEARRLLEVELIGMAAERASDREVSEIQAWLEAMNTCLEDAQAYASADFEFHLAIARCAHNTVLFRVVDTLRRFLAVVIAQVTAEQRSMRESFAEHAAIFEALRARDITAARQAMSAHIDRSECRLLSFIKNKRPLGDLHHPKENTI